MLKIVVCIFKVRFEFVNKFKRVFARPFKVIHVEQMFYVIWLMNSQNGYQRTNKPTDVITIFEAKSNFSGLQNVFVFVISQIHDFF